jgi:glycerate dehydrogenase
MEIVFLDADTTDAGDIDLCSIERIGQLTCHGVTAPDEVAERVADAEVVLTNKVVLGALEMEAASRLGLICVCASGVDNIDLDAARQRQIAVANVEGYSTPGVVQHAVGLLLNLATNTHRYAGEAQLWAQSPIFCRFDHPVVELAGRRVGIVGSGRIGSGVGRTLEALGMEVVALARDPAQVGETTPQGWRRLGWQAFFSSCHAVSLHCPLTEQTAEMISRATLALMPRGAFLVNASRGGLVDEVALVEALHSGRLGGAALDVISREPPGLDHPLLDSTIPNLLLTPHCAWASRSSRQRLVEEVAENIRSFLVGERNNRID